MSQKAYKVCSAAEWRAAAAKGAYDGSPDDARDGFIHLSTGAQLAETLRRHFSGRGDLIVVAFDAATLGAALKWEASRGGDLFPHFYGALPTALAIDQRALPEDAAARTEFVGRLE